jgi:hypothetical protein
MARMPKLKIEDVTVQIVVLGMAIIGIFLGLWYLGVFTGYIPAVEPYIIGGLLIIWGSTLLAETLYEDGGIRGLSDLTPKSMIALVVAIITLIIGLTSFFGLTIPERLLGIVAIDFLAVSILLTVELYE